MFLVHFYGRIEPSGTGCLRQSDGKVERGMRGRVVSGEGTEGRFQAREEALGHSTLPRNKNVNGTKLLADRLGRPSTAEQTRNYSETVSERGKSVARWSYRKTKT